MAYGMTREEIDEAVQRVSEMLLDKGSELWADIPAERRGQTDMFFAKAIACFSRLIIEVVLENNARWEQALREVGVPLNQ